MDLRQQSLDVTGQEVLTRDRVNDRMIALMMLKNAEIAANGILP